LIVRRLQVFQLAGIKPASVDSGGHSTLSEKVKEQALANRDLRLALTIRGAVCSVPSRAIELLFLRSRKLHAALRRRPVL
jgi:hypothetical protein